MDAELQRDEAAQVEAFIARRTALEKDPGLSLDLGMLSKNTHPAPSHKSAFSVMPATDESPAFTPSSGPKTRRAPTSLAQTDASVMPGKAASNHDPTSNPAHATVGFETLVDPWRWGRIMERDADAGVMSVKHKE